MYAVPVVNKTYHPQNRKRCTDKSLSVLMWRPHIEHDIADDVVVQSKRSLLRQPRDEAYQVSQQLEHLVLVVAG